MKEKNIIIAIMALIVCVIIIIISLLVLNRENHQLDDELVDNQEEFIIKYENNVTSVKNKNDYFAINQCVNYYFQYINQEKSEYLLGILDNDYIKKSKIALNNIYKYTYEKKGDNLVYSIIDMGVVNSGIIDNYVVYCKVLDNLNEKDIYLIVTCDNTNSTFSITPQSGEYSSISEVRIEKDTTNIEENEYNKISYNLINNETMCKKLLQDYVEKVVYFPKEAYETLNEEYKEKRFGDYTTYRNYLKNNIDMFKLMELNNAKSYYDFNSEEEFEKYYKEKLNAGLTKYQINQYDNYTQYICIDGQGNYYIFNVTSAMNYSVILDTYTIDLPQFTEQYESAKAQGKVVLNIQKVIDALNAQDYNYVYNKLSTTYKNNYFSSENDFESFIKSNLFKNNEVKYTNFKEENNAYSYELLLTDADGKKSGQVNMYIAMQLEENSTDFTIAFSIK